MNYRTDTVFYQIGKVIWLPFLIAGVWFAAYGFPEYGDLFACSIKKICGFPCPGCGGTRSLYYFFKGDFYKSFRYHPVVIYGVLSYLHFMGLFFLRKHIYKNNKKEIKIQYYIYGAIAVIVLQWLIKIINILLIL